MHPSDRALYTMPTRELSAYAEELQDLIDEHGRAQYEDRLAMVEAILLDRGIWRNSAGEPIA